MDSELDAAFRQMERATAAALAIWIAAAWMCGEIATAYGRSRGAWIIFALLCPGLSLACALNLKAPRPIAGISKRKTRPRATDTDPGQIIAPIMSKPVPAFP